MANRKAIDICHKRSKTKKNAITASSASKSFIVYLKDRQPEETSLQTNILTHWAILKIYILYILFFSTFI